MRAGAQDNERNLTGVWQGLYTYPDGLSVSFVATLIESGRWLSGSTHEPCSLPGSPGGTACATLSGSRQDSSVVFVKTYEGAIPGYERPVDYQGALSGDGTEIEGRWSIAGILSGKFLMIRSAGKAAELTQTVTTRV
jgi:hypothetical protein